MANQTFDTSQTDLTKQDFVIVDTETTGVLQNMDRVVEIAIVRLDHRGTISDEWVTLVNPRRDLGPTSIHGISAGHVQHAPDFSEIAADVLTRLSNAILVGHNVYFDLGMLRSEFRRLDYEFPKIPAVCTMRLASRYGASVRKLSECCEYFGFNHADAHSALDDAKATGELLRRYISRSASTLYEGVTGEIVALSFCFKLTGKTCNRDRARQLQDSSIPYLRQLVAKLPQWGSEETANYLDVLERTLEDRRITADEQQELERVALELGLSSHAVRNVHMRYLTDLICTAFEDGIVSESERADLECVARLFDMTTADLDAAIVSAISKTRSLAKSEALSTGEPASAPSSSQPQSDQLLGKIVCFTGALQSKINGVLISRQQALELAADRGLVTTDSLTKKVDILVVADPDSMSGKAEKARKYGTRVMADNVFWRAIGVRVD